MWYYQLQPLEHDHQFLKDAGKRLIVSHQPGPAEEITIGSYQRHINTKGGVELRTVSQHTRTTKTVARTEQLLVMSHLRKTLREVCLSTAEKAREYEKTKRKERQRKIADNAKLERDLDKLACDT